MSRCPLPPFPPDPTRTLAPICLRVTGGVICANTPLLSLVSLRAQQRHKAGGCNFETSAEFTRLRCSLTALIVVA